MRAKRDRSPRLKMSGRFPGDQCEKNLELLRGFFIERATRGHHCGRLELTFSAGRAKRAGSESIGRPTRRRRLRRPRNLEVRHRLAELAQLKYRCGRRTFVWQYLLFAEMCVRARARVCMYIHVHCVKKKVRRRGSRRVKRTRFRSCAR